MAMRASESDKKGSSSVARALIPLHTSPLNLRMAHLPINSRVLLSLRSPLEAWLCVICWPAVASYVSAYIQSAACATAAAAGGKGWGVGGVGGAEAGDVYAVVRAAVASTLATHLIAEGPRWQLAGVYMAALLSVVGPQITSRIGFVLTSLVCAALLLATSVACYVLPSRLPPRGKTIRGQYRDIGGSVVHLTAHKHTNGDIHTPPSDTDTRTDTRTHTTPTKHTPTKRKNARTHQTSIAQAPTETQQCVDDDNNVELMLQMFWPCVRPSVGELFRQRWIEVARLGAGVLLSLYALYRTTSLPHTHHAHTHVYTPTLPLLLLPPLLLLLESFIDIFSHRGSMPYTSEGYATATSIASYANVPAVLTSHLATFRLNVHENARPLPSSQGTKMPLIIFLHGISGNRTAYSQMVLEYASQGYVVAVPEFNDGTACLTVMPDGTRNPYRAAPRRDPMKWRITQLDRRVAELELVLQHLDSQQSALHIDTSTIWLAGHSFGAATILHMLLSSPQRGESIRHRVGGIALLDSWLEPVRHLCNVPLEVPALVVHCDLFGGASHRKDEDALCRDAKGPLLQIRLRDTGHVNFSDFALLTPVLTTRLKKAGHVDPVSSLCSVNSMVLSFFESCQRWRTASTDNNSDATKPVAIEVRDREGGVRARDVVKVLKETNGARYIKTPPKQVKQE